MISSDWIIHAGTAYLELQNLIGYGNVDHLFCTIFCILDT
jgi:hypothetical protein